jgi:hypothetical protein
MKKLGKNATKTIAIDFGSGYTKAVYFSQYHSIFIGVLLPTKPRFGVSNHYFKE